MASSLATVNLKAMVNSLATANLKATANLLQARTALHKVNTVHLRGNTVLLHHPPITAPLRPPITAHLPPVHMAHPAALPTPPRRRPRRRPATSPANSPTRTCPAPPMTSAPP
jgi:hypothetical protein